jgi:hypothetical protein
MKRYSQAVAEAAAAFSARDLALAFTRSNVPCHARVPSLDKCVGTNAAAFSNAATHAVASPALNAFVAFAN